MCFKTLLKKLNEQKKKIGKGSFSSVYFDYVRNICIKKINIEKYKDIISNEIHILEQYSCHQHIISYLGHKKTKHNVHIYLEYAPLGDLQNWINHKKQKNMNFISKQTIIQFIFQITSAIDYLHQNHIIHKDIKPQNILCFHNNLFKLTDFGISIFYNLENINLNHICGTPRYIAPEIINQTQYDHKIDFWSFGCVLYELVYLTKIFDKDNIYKVAYCIVHDKLSFLWKKKPIISVSL